MNLDRGRLRQWFRCRAETSGRHQCDRWILHRGKHEASRLLGTSGRVTTYTWRDRA